jgi:hypothetical protein
VALRLHGMRPGPRVFATMLVTLAALAALPRAVAVTPPATLRAEELDRAIEHTLSGRDFRWALRPAPKPPDPAGDGPVLRFLKEGARWISDLADSLWTTLRRWYDWLTDSSRPESTSSPILGRGVTMSGMSVVMVVLLSALAMLLIFISVVVWRRTRMKTPLMAATKPVVTVPDLQSESTEASQLPADGWLALAHSQMERGEWRLAWRALYLATLARLGDEGLVSLAKFKTNLDYERELWRRALAREEIPRQFSVRRRGFEAAWYGNAQPGEADVRAWLAELERPALP